MTKIHIPVYQPKMAGREREFVNECLDSSWISSRGRFIPAFEESFASFVGAGRAIAVSNGTVALHLALLALDIKAGDEVIVPTFSYVATVNAVKYVNAIPVFADCIKDTWQIDPEDIERKITPRTKAILATHLYGHPCDMDALLKICTKHKLFLIEDCAEAIGSRYKDKHVGTFGHISTFSFYGNKTITTGEGGIVLSTDQHLLDKMYTFKMQGVSPTRQYWHEVIGYNYKMTNICAAIGLAQMDHLNEVILKKIELAKWYTAFFTKHGIDFHKTVGPVVHSYWMFSILVKEEATRDFLRKHLLDVCGIETRPTFYPVHTMPMYFTPGLRLPNSENIGCRGLNLPSYPDLTIEQLEYIGKSIVEFLQ
jgi:perosamine synthetase